MLAYTKFLEAFDYDHPADSEKRLEPLAREAEAAGDHEVLAEILAQIARTKGLQNRFNEGHETLARAEALKPKGMRAAARIAIERGRLFRSGGDAGRAKPFFIAACEQAEAAGDDYLALDALHMVALVVPFEEALQWANRGYDLAARSRDPKTIHWVAVLHNNIGWSLVTRGEHAPALSEFEAAFEAYRQEGASARMLRIAEYAIGLAWRKLGRAREALDLQLRIAKAAEADGSPDHYFEKEVAECFFALGRRGDAQAWAKKALIDGPSQFSPEDGRRLAAFANDQVPERS